MAARKFLFPKMIISNWWELRRIAQKTPDVSFTPENISFLLNISLATVYANVIPALRQFELIDKNGNLTERGRRWLNDEEYKDVCTDILENIYPVELLNEIENPLDNRNAVKEWFKKKTNSNMNSILQMTATYNLLWKGDPNEAHEKQSAKRTYPEMAESNNQNEQISVDNPDMQSGANGVHKRKYTKRNILPAESFHHGNESAVGYVPSQAAAGEAKIRPAININIEFVITNSTPSSQIESLFASMGKYLIVK